MLSEAAEQSRQCMVGGMNIWQSGVPSLGLLVHLILLENFYELQIINIQNNELQNTRPMGLSCSGLAETPY